jgi:hypothetical protein
MPSGFLVWIVWLVWLVWFGWLVGLVGWLVGLVGWLVNWMAWLVWFGLVGFYNMNDFVHIISSKPVSAN